MPGLEEKCTPGPLAARGGGFPSDALGSLARSGALARDLTGHGPHLILEALEGPAEHRHPPDETHRDGDQRAANDDRNDEPPDEPDGHGPMLQGLLLRQEVLDVAVVLEQVVELD